MNIGTLSIPLPIISGNLQNGRNSTIRIIGINRDKTRRREPAGKMYQVYLELSEAPTRAWCSLFESEWKKEDVEKSKEWLEAGIDRKFLVIHCTLSEIGESALPLLNKAVAATNAAYDDYLLAEAEREKQAGKLWNEERAEVDRVADALRFDEV